MPDAPVEHDLSAIIDSLSEKDMLAISNIDRKIKILSSISMTQQNLIAFLAQGTDVALEMCEFAKVGENISILRRLAEQSQYAENKLIEIYHAVVEKYDLPFDCFLRLMVEEKSLVEPASMSFLAFAYATKKLESTKVMEYDPDVACVIGIYEQLLWLSGIDLTKTQLSSAPLKLYEALANGARPLFSLVNNLAVASFKYLAAQDSAACFQKELEACIDSLYLSLNHCRHQDEHPVGIFNLFNMMDMAGHTQKSFFSQIKAAHSAYDSTMTYCHMQNSQRQIMIHYPPASSRSGFKRFILFRKLADLSAADQTRSG